MIKSRAYYDLYAFYVPIRLLWDGFPDFLASKEGEITPPQTSSLFPQNFENDFVGQDGATVNPTNAAFLRRAYYLIHRTFFQTHKHVDGTRYSDHGEKIRNGDFDETVGLKKCLARSSTLDESWLFGASVETQDIPVAGSVVTLDDVRRAYALDRWEKMKDYYGTRYTDVLKGYGVKADWGMLQEPECIGISNNDFSFKPRSSSGDTNYGDRRGFFEGEFKLKLKKTFTPEHGIIAVMAVGRTDTFNQTQGAHILCTRDLATPTTFWDPISASAYNNQTVPGKLIDQAGVDDVTTTLHEHLRKGRNEMALDYATSWGEIPVVSKTMSANVADHNLWLQNICTPGPADFADSSEITHYTEVRVAKRSPVKPAAVTTQR
jgi:hypothetical protein